MVNHDLELLICFSISLFTYAQEPKDWPWNHAQKNYTIMIKNVDSKTKLAIVVVNNNKVYQGNQWSRDNENEVDQLEGKTGDEITVGCQIYHEDGLVPVLEDTMIAVRRLGSSYQFGESCKGKLTCWFNFTLTEPAFVTCLGQGPEEQALFYRVRIDLVQPTTSPLTTPIEAMTIVPGKMRSRPGIFTIGPYVIRKTGQQIVLFNPQWSLKKVELQIQVNISNIRPDCSPFLRTSYEGWTTWLRRRRGAYQSLYQNRMKRDVTGIVGTGLGVLNAIDSEVIMNKLAATTRDISKLQQPLRSSLLALGAQQWLISKVVPDWGRANTEDHLFIADAVGTLQGDIALAMSCIQAQLWMQTVAESIIREGEEGILPTEIRKMVWDNATETERRLQSWWNMVNFTYDPETHTVTAFVLTIYDAVTITIYPIVALGINHNGTLLYPIEHRTWARKIDHRWQTIDLESCIMKEQRGFICESNTLIAQDTCLDTDQKVCHFEARPNVDLKTIIIYTGKGCACLRTQCNMIIIDGQEEKLHQSNYCICNFTTIVGCDFNYSAPVLTHSLLNSKLTLVQTVLPVSIGLNMTHVKDLLQHKDLQHILREIKERGQETLLTVHHDAGEIKEILRRVEQDGKHSWWETLLGWSPTATGVLNYMIHPIVILLISVGIVFVLTLVLYLWVWRMFRRLTIMYEAMYFSGNLTLTK